MSIHLRAIDYVEPIKQNGLVGLQQLEAEGKMPFSKGMQKGIKLSEKNTKTVARWIGRAVGASPDFIECVDWLEDLYYKKDYGALSIGLCQAGNIKGLEYMRIYVFTFLRKLG